MVSSSLCFVSWRSRVDERMKRNKGFDLVVVTFKGGLRGGRRIDWIGLEGGRGSWQSRMSEGASIAWIVLSATLRTVSGVAFPPGRVAQPKSRHWI